MMLTERVAHAVAAGEVDVAYRRWRVPRVKAGSQFRSVAGVIRIDSIERVPITELNDADARRAGFQSVDDLIETFRGHDADPVFRIALSFAGADGRDELATASDLTAQDVAAIGAELDRLDRRTLWARHTLSRLRAEPGVTAAVLAGELDLEKEPFKRRVRKLKELGLTRSLRIGYDLSDRGRAYLDAVDSER